ncbi:MAG: hypothetical protein R3B54_16685 [Bdellovibrionota bacterium]
MFRLALGFVTFFYPLLGEGLLPEAHALEAACSKPVRLWCSPATCSDLPTYESFGEKESENEFSKRKAFRNVAVTAFSHGISVELSQDRAYIRNLQDSGHNCWSNRAPPSL